MNIIALSDIHGKLPAPAVLEDILAPADVALLVGDLTNFGGDSEAGAVVSPITKQLAKVFAVSGNCDYHGVDDYLNKKGINLHGKASIFNNIGFVGLGGSLVTPFGTPNELSESEIDQALKKSLSDFPEHTPMILVSHQPPINTACDRIATGAHVGSISIRKFIQAHQPLICFTGHIHESCGMDKIGNTYIINPGQFSRGGYAYAEIQNGIITADIRRWR